MADITGTTGNDTLVGTAGADRIEGLQGNDSLNGAGGADLLIGGEGDDLYFLDDPLDAITESVGQGFDVAYSGVSYALAAGVEVEVLSVNDLNATVAINLTGNEFGQQIFGNAGDNFLIAGGGADALYGGLGNDTYSVDTLDIVFDSGGNDIIYSSSNYQLNAGSEIETLSAADFAATTALNLAGNEYGQSIFGNAGANFLIAGGGADGLYGGLGDDTYSVDTLDVVVDTGGFDIIYSSTNFQLNVGAQIEILSANDYALTTPLNLAGNEFGQQIFGNAGDNFLIAGGGADGLYGKGGNDTYSIDSLDVVVENAGEGYDTLYTSTSFILGAGTEIEVISVNDYAATSAINLTGNEFGQQIFGNAGMNILDGGGGNDQLTGGAGGDVFDFTTALGAGNIDTISDFQHGMDKIRLSASAGQPFAALAGGNINASSFVVGAAALDANDYLIYNSATGALLYDADGNGAGAAVQFATLQTGLALAASDFAVATLVSNSPPAITSGATASIAENSAASTIVYQIAATDADGDRITYRVTGADAALVNVDAVTGAVRLNAPADFEAKSSYTFNVLAEDSNATTVKIGVVLTITDVQEAAPAIINETGGDNDSRTNAQVIDRNLFTITNNPNLPNDDLPSATIVGSVIDNLDQDYYAITLQAGEQLILDVDGTTNGIDTHLFLFGPTGAAIGDNDDSFDPDTGSGEQFGHVTDSQIFFRAATSGTYYFKIQSFEFSSNGNYQINVSIGPQATPAQLQEEDINALISGAEWDHHTLTYGFPQNPTDYPASFTEPDNGFAGFTSVQQNATRALLQLVANVSDLTFAENVANPGQADLRYATSEEPDVAYAYYPTNQGPNNVGGSAWFNNGPVGTRFTNPLRGNYAWMGILHETGHALGLKHGHEFPLAISADHDSVEYSVMTYRSFPGGSVTGGYSNETFGYAQTLMQLDIAALQRMYGANYGFNAGNSIYSWNPNTGEMSINGAGQGAPGNGTPGSNRVFMTIWDGGGTDTYDLSAYGGGTTVDLRPGEWTTTSSTQLANLGAGNTHFARGNVANALMFDNNPNSLIENAIGGAGNDTIIANQAANTLTGNGGVDNFTWKAGTDAGTGGAHDTIADFLRGTDKIDLSAVDANSGTGANDTFSFIGTGAFTNTAGQLRYDVTSGSAHIFADLDGNGIADMEIVVSNVTTLATSDFFL